MKKRLLYLLLLVALLAALLTTQATALSVGDTFRTTYTDASYNYSCEYMFQLTASDKVTLILVPAQNKTLYRIPSTITYGGVTYTVTGIGDSVFSGNTVVQQVKLPPTLKTLGESVFSGCTALTTINLPSGLTSLGMHCFFECKSLKGDEGGKLVIPAGVQTIPAYAFYSCEAITTLTFQEGLQEIGEKAFIDCWSITRLDFPSSLRKIGNEAFASCLSVGMDVYDGERCYIEVPAGVKEIGDAAFAYTGANGIDLHILYDGPKTYVGQDLRGEKEWGPAYGTTHHILAAPETTGFQNGHGSWRENTLAWSYQLRIYRGEELVVDKAIFTNYFAAADYLTETGDYTFQIRANPSTIDGVNYEQSEFSAPVAFRYIQHHTVTATAINGTVSPGGVTTVKGNTETFILSTPSWLYGLTKLTLNGKEVEKLPGRSLEDGTYTFSLTVDQDYTLEATFTQVAVEIPDPQITGFVDADGNDLTTLPADLTQVGVKTYYAVNSRCMLAAYDEKGRMLEAQMGELNNTIAQFTLDRSQPIATLRAFLLPADGWVPKAAMEELKAAR